MQTKSNAGALSVAEIHSLHSRDRFHRKIANDKMSGIILSSEIISEEQELINKPINVWADELRAVLQSNRSEQLGIPELISIYEQAIYIFISRGCFKQAREICYSQIQLLMNSTKQHDNQFLKCGMQAWINLAKIDRIEGNYFDAHKKINIILAKDLVHGNQLFHASIYQDVNYHQRIIQLAQLEKIKLYFITSRFKEIIRDFSGSKTIFVIEALISAYIKLGKHSDALALLSDAKHHLSQHPILELLECEIVWFVFQDERIVDRLSGIYKKLLYAVQSSQVTANTIRYSLFAGRLLHHLGMNAESNTLAYHCLQAAYLLQDEILKAESLVCMFIQITTMEGRQIIEDMMIALYHQTHYVKARQQLLTCFQDLKHVEKNDEVINLEFLLDDLCAWVQ